MVNKKKKKEKKKESSKFREFRNRLASLRRFAN